MDDEVVGGWSIDPDTRLALRLDRVRKALEQGDHATAVVEAEELLDEAPDHPDALFLLGEALLELGDAQGAVEAYEQFLQVAQPDDPAHAAAALGGLAIARFEACVLSGAAEAAREAIRLAPDMAEAHYYLGLSLERVTGRQSEAVAEFVAANRLDPAAYPLPAQLDDAAWKAVVKQAMSRLHPRLITFWDDVPIRLDDLPSMDELRRADPPITPTASGLYEGEPPDVDEAWTQKPTALRLFRRNLARLGELELIVDEVASTLENEALDWVGATLDDLD